jgi:hypothetical protein
VALFVVGAMIGRRQPVAASRFAMPGAVGNVGPLELSVVVTGRVEACPLPSSVRGLTPDSSFYVRSSKGGAGLHGIRALTQGRSRAFRVGRNGAPLLGVGRGVARSQRVRRAEPAPQGSDVLNLRPRGRTSGNLPPGDQEKPWSRPLAVRSILIVREREFSFFGYLKIATRQ